MDSPSSEIPLIGIKLKVGKGLFKSSDTIFLLFDLSLSGKLVWPGDYVRVDVIEWGFKTLSRLGGKEAYRLPNK